MAEMCLGNHFLHTACERDRVDELASFRARFALPCPIYLCGHSLGPQSDSAREAVLQHLDKWAQEGVDGHFQGDDQWSTLEDTSSDSDGCDLVGANIGEVVYMNSLTVNLHLMMTTFYIPDVSVGRVQVLMEDYAFPSDDIAVQTHLRSRGIDPAKAIVRLKPRDKEHVLRDEDIFDQISSRAKLNTLALVLLPGVQYYTGQVMPMHQIAQLCKTHNVPLGLDLAHAVGNIPLHLHDWGVDFAVWCSYKYLNAGPGAVAGAFVHAKHDARTDLHRLGGWWGHERKSRFLMQGTFLPQKGAYGFQMSNPPVLALAPVAASIRLFREAGGMPALRAKSLLLAAFLEECLLDKLRDNLQILTPSDPEKRGCQLSLRLVHLKKSAKFVQSVLRSRGILCDVREPDVLRVSLNPLYNSFRDAEAFVRELAEIVEKERLT